MQENFYAGVFLLAVWHLAKASGKVGAPCQQTILDNVIFPTTGLITDRANASVMIFIAEGDCL